MYSLNDTLRCVSTFGNLRIEAYLQLPAAYRSLSRPSSAPDAKAFALCSCSLELPYWFYSACSLELLSFFKQIFFAAKKHLSSFLRSTFRWNCNFTHFLGKTKLISQFCPLKSVRFLLILSKFLLNIFIFLFDCQGSYPHTVRWSVWMDSNHRPRAYQARALTTWATDRYSCSGIFLFDHRSPTFKSVVEMMGIEPMTPCLQGRCSPSWATPPYWVFNWTLIIEQQKTFQSSASLIHILV